MKKTKINYKIIFLTSIFILCFIGVIFPQPPPPPPGDENPWAGSPIEGNLTLLLAFGVIYAARFSNYFNLKFFKRKK